MIPFSAQCTQTNVCRSLREVLYIAFLRIERFKINLPEIKSVYLTSVKPNLVAGQVSKILVSIPNLIESTTDSVNGAPIFKYYDFN
jgi:hypothetical protein